MTTEPPVFTLGTLRDIFELPTCAQMEKALAELSKLMVVTRNYQELLSMLAQDAAIKDGVELPPDSLKFRFPETVQWTDDIGGTSEVGLVDFGKLRLTHSKKVAPHQNAE